MRFSIAFDTRWSVRALRNVGLDKTGVKHFDIATIEGYDASRRSIFTCGAFHSHGLQHYVPLVDRPPVLKYGIASSVEAWSEVCALARQSLGLPAQGVSLHKVPTSDDTKVLLEHCVASGGQINFTKLAQVANARGLLFSVKSAETWLVAVQHREVAFLDLHAAKYGELMRSLHDACAVPEAHRHAQELEPAIATSEASNPIQLPAPACSVMAVGAIVARPQPALPIADDVAIVVGNATVGCGYGCSCMQCLFGSGSDDDCDGSTTRTATNTDNDAFDGDDVVVGARRKRPKLSNRSPEYREQRRMQNRLSQARFRCSHCESGNPCDDHADAASFE